MNIAFANYITGFTDGEGSFVLAIQRQNGREHPRAIFQIIVRSDDFPILSQIRDYFGCGRIYHHTRKGRTTRCPEWHSSHFMVYRPEELLGVIVPHFKAFPLRAKKARDFIIWEQAVALCCRVRARRQVGGVGNGPLAKWTDKERIEFATHLDTIKAQRTFRMPKSLEPLAVAETNSNG